MNRIGLIGENSVVYIDRLLNIWNNGDCAVLIDWRIPLNTAIEMMRDAHVNKCYIEKAYLKYNIVNVCPDIEFVMFEKSGTNYIEELSSEIYEKFHENYSRTDALILYSSGTTGKAKGVILSHYAINLNADLINEYMQLSNEDSIYIVKAFAHSSTIIGELLIGLKNKIKIIVSSTLVSPSDSLNNINNYKATILCVNPSLLYLYTVTAKMKKMKYEFLKKIYTSGSIAEKELLESAINVFKNTEILNIYGLSEAGPRVSAQRNKDQLGTVGIPLRGVLVKILKQDNKEARPLEKGVVYVNTPCKLTGYINKCQTKGILSGDWINTGDVGYFDNNNNLHIVGRNDNMVVVGSHNVYPEGIEQRLKYGCDVDDCIIVTEKSKIYGERMICLYVSENDVLEQLQLYCNHNLAFYEIPYKFIKVNQLLSTYNGKKVRDINSYSAYFS